ncbi:hypothetical protein [Roseibium sp. MMSF_3412]|uniref:hypothetical protein n=1 Tax=Roseibium sp. MMSF_3412 TaxID=3046712 RepID=UPI00273DA5D6|nr:hypothetical protein [Roseibium sp. MMSF_3412]
MSGKQTVDLSTVRTEADSVFKNHVLGFKDPGNPLFRTVCVPRIGQDPSTTRLRTGSSFLESAHAVPRKRNAQPIETGSVRHISKADDVPRGACVLSLFDARASGHSRMDETALLRKNRTEERDNCAGETPLVDLPIVAAKREQNSMKPLMRQTLKNRGQSRICPESTILVGTSTLTTQTRGVVSKNSGGL